MLPAKISRPHAAHPFAFVSPCSASVFAESESTTSLGLDRPVEACLATHHDRTLKDASDRNLLPQHSIHEHLHFVGSQSVQICIWLRSPSFTLTRLRPNERLTNLGTSVVHATLVASGDASASGGGHFPPVACFGIIPLVPPSPATPIAYALPRSTPNVTRQDGYARALVKGRE